MRNVRAAVLGMILMTSISGFAEDAPSRRGAFEFHYEPRLSAEALAWYSQFDVLVTLDPLPRAQVERLHAAGTRLLLYEWSIAFYESRATQWQKSLVEKSREALLNAAPLTGYSGSDVAQAWYFDPASPHHATARSADLVRRITQNDYDGVFLDATTIESVHPEEKRVERRHPDTPYDAAYSGFLIELRKELPTITIITNQGYRSPENYLPYVDADLTESLITRPRDGAFQIRPWNDAADPWNSIYFLMRNVIEPLSSRYPAVRFSHLNYIDGASPETIRLAIAVARIFESDAFTAAASIPDEVDSIYFYDFGRPVSARVDLDNGNATYRVFERGVIAISCSSKEIVIEDLPERALPITLPASTGEPRAYFFQSVRGPE